MTLKEFSESRNEGTWDYNELRVLFPDWPSAERFRDSAREVGLEAWAGMINEQVFVFQYQKNGVRDDISRTSRE